MYRWKIYLKYFYLRKTLSWPERNVLSRNKKLKKNLFFFWVILQIITVELWNDNLPKKWTRFLSSIQLAKNRQCELQKNKNRRSASLANQVLTKKRKHSLKFTKWRRCRLQWDFILLDAIYVWRTISPLWIPEP